MGHYVNFKEELQQRTDYAEEVIRRWLPEERGFSKTMAQAMNYSMCAGGKRLRPILLLETLRLFGGDEKLAEPFMAGIEMIHTHSLIHDDLPAIDNDDYRRGRLTTHKVYGEAMGVLSGVTLLNYAYETMFRAFELTDDKDRVIRAVRIMAEKTGIYGMLGGQSVDVENDGKPLEKDLLDYIYEHKTSALIEASMMAGAVLAGADEEQTSMIEQAASDIGLWAMCRRPLHWTSTPTSPIPCGLRRRQRSTRGSQRSIPKRKRWPQSEHRRQTRSHSSPSFPTTARSERPAPAVSPRSVNTAGRGATLRSGRMARSTPAMCMLKRGRNVRHSCLG